MRWETCKTLIEEAWKMVKEFNGFLAHTNKSHKMKKVKS
jgi:hypothetical protein